MRQVNVHEAKTHLSRLLEQVEAGEEIILARGGTPIARLTRYTPDAPAGRTPGRLKGQIVVHPGFLEADVALEKAFGDGELFPRAKPPHRARKPR